ncbi:MAG: ABC transporter substrate-binding protein [Gammaproteobacteria bacterium]|nr:ABC transporter substrate-binding protein [Gammaproteobacteria bacterium]
MLKLSFACGPYDRTEALQYKRIDVEGIDLDYLEIQVPRQIFDRMVGERAFDMSELSLSEYIVMTCKGNSPFVALPVFPSKSFRHGFITINAKSGIKAPGDLAGKRIGVPLYTMTAAIWIRGDLQNIYGVDLSDVQWIQGAVEKPGAHGNPPNVPVLLQPANIVQNTSDKSLSEMLRDGEIDALIGSRLPETIRTDPDKVTRLFPNPREEEKRYYLEHHIHPIMHTVVIQRKIYEENRWIAPTLFKAFEEARNWAMERMYFSAAQRYMLPWLFDDLHEVDAVFGKDLWAYGVEKNRSTLEALVNYMQQQHFIEEIVSVDDLFVPIQEL